jgi:hypothetical protein
MPTTERYTGSDNLGGVARGKADLELLQEVNRFQKYIDLAGICAYQQVKPA